MFDDLHDPDPPTADSNHFADVSERAHSMRTRRYTIFGAASLAGVVAVGAFAFAATGGGDDDLVVSPGGSGDGPGVPVAADTTTSTTVLPTATTVPPQTTIRVTTTTEPAPTSTTTTTEKPPVTDPPPATTEPPPPETTQAPPATDPPPAGTEPPAPGPVAGPIVAIDGAGDAVLFADSASSPVLLYDGTDPDDPAPPEVETTAVVSLAATADGSVAFISDCCEPAAGSIVEARPPTPATLDDITYLGMSPAIDGTGTKLALADIFGSVAIYEIGGDNTVSVRAPEPEPGTFWISDLAWPFDDLLVAFGYGGDSWILRTYAYDGASITPVKDTVVAPFTGQPDRELGGIDGSGSAIVHRAGTSSYQVVPLSDAGEPGMGELPGPALSMWISADGVLTWVDDQRVLRVDGQVVPGEYTWARR